MLNLKNNYWKNFYENYRPPIIHSDFAEFTLGWVDRTFGRGTKKSLVDLGCGNGRDLIYFFNSGWDVEGIDLYSTSNYYKIKKEDLLQYKESKDIYYLRFLLHTLKEVQLDILLSNIYHNMKEDSLIFIETRSSKGITDLEKSETRFKSPIGKEHFRVLYSHNYLISKLQQFFMITFSFEDRGFAKFKEENPYIIRIVCKK